MAVSDPSGQPVAFGWDDPSGNWLEVPGVGTFNFRADDDVITAYPTAARDELIHEYQTVVLPMALHVAGWEALHASAVANGSLVAILCGYSGTGKSTTAFALSQRGYELWADDAVLIEPESEPVQTHRMPFAPNLKEESLRFFGVEETPPVGPKRKSPRRLGAIFILKRRSAGDHRIAVERLQASEALGALVPHAFRLELSRTEARRRTVANYLHLVAHVPVFEVSYLSGFDGLALVVDEIEGVLLGAGS